MYLPEEPGFSALYRMDTDTNHRRASMEYRYTLNTLLGLQRVRAQGIELPWDLNAIYTRYIRDIDQPYVNPANAGMSKWVAHELGRTVPDSVENRVNNYLRDSKNWDRWEAQDVGWMILGLTASPLESDLEKASHLVQFVRDWMVELSTGLFRYRARGFRRDVASFGGIVYLTYAMLRYGRVTDDQETVDVGIRACRKLLEIQGPQGQWPWMINVRRGIVADWYQVYAVHQDSMAALFLTEALAVGCDEGRDAIVKGFKWVFGNNELNHNMVSPKHGMIERSLVRKGRFERARRLARLLLSLHTGYCDPVTKRLQILPECRSYHLGWMLYVFSGRSDFDEIINHPAFNNSNEGE